MHTLHETIIISLTTYGACITWNCPSHTLLNYGNVYTQEYIRKSMQPHIVVVKTSLSGFDVTAGVVVGREYG